MNQTWQMKRSPLKIQKEISPLENNKNATGY